ncbi:MAG: IS630 family transposase, partial [Betaproteobacteria bacterium]|nr:IS630 family transposase [Betaproteobacteria bacterium]MCL2022034.1 IS630 family transposase [Betaproteobacteria bacterium]
MDKEDGRRLSREAQHERRKQAVRLHRQGITMMAIAATLGVA